MNSKVNVLFREGGHCPLWGLCLLLARQGPCCQGGQGGAGKDRSPSLWSSEPCSNVGRAPCVCPGPGRPVSRFQLLNLSFPPQEVGMFKVSRWGAGRVPQMARAEQGSWQLSGDRQLPRRSPVRLVLVYPLPACPEHRSPRTAFSGVQEGTLPCPQRLRDFVKTFPLCLWGSGLRACSEES